MRPPAPLADRIAAALDSKDVRHYEWLLREAKDQLRHTESLLLDLLGQNPNYTAHGGLAARVQSFLQDYGKRRRGAP